MPSPLHCNPANISYIYEFSVLLGRMLANPHAAGRTLVYYVDQKQHISSAIFLIGAYLVLYERMSAEEAFGSFANLDRSLQYSFQAACSTHRGATLEHQARIQTSTSVFESLCSLEHARNIDMLNYGMHDCGFLHHACSNNQGPLPQKSLPHSGSVREGDSHKQQQGGVCCISSSDDDEACYDRGFLGEVDEYIMRDLEREILFERQQLLARSALGACDPG